MNRVLILWLFFLTNTGYAQSWKPLAPLSKPRTSFGFVQCNGYFYAIGGEGITNSSENPAYLKSIEVYNPATNEWYEKNDLPIAISFPGVTNFNNEIYLFGGQTINFKRVGHYFNYDSGSDKWLIIGELPVGYNPIGTPNIITSDSCVFLLTSKSIFIYKPHNNSWDSLALNSPLPILSTIVVRNDTLFSFGGGDWGMETSSVLYFDSNEKCWKNYGEIPYHAAEISSVLVSDDVFILGGCTKEKKLLRHFFMLSKKEMKWFPLESMPELLHFPSVIAFDDTIYLCGGTQTLYRYNGHSKNFYAFKIPHSN